MAYISEEMPCESTGSTMATCVTGGVVGGFVGRFASGAFSCQATASSYVGRVAGKAKSSASGLYVGFYYLGGCCGSILPGLLWRQTGWAGCGIILVAMQGITA